MDFDIYLKASNDILIRSKLTIDDQWIRWRNKPINIGCNTSLISSLIVDDVNVTLSIYPSLKVQVFCKVREDALKIETELKKLPKNSKTSNRSSIDRLLMQSNTILCNLISKKQVTCDEYSITNFKEGFTKLAVIADQSRLTQLRNRLLQWCNVIKKINTPLMNQDRIRWRYHAISNQDLDLQAWYHAVYFHEVYRPRGHFWYRDALLPSYRHSYDLVDNTLSPMEEAALAHVLCSPETSYGDVAGQMFVMQSIVSNPILFTLFQKCSSQGINVTKYPRTGHPSKKVFRFSFVEGSIYFTWKGKHGNQGVDLADVSDVTIGRSTDILRKNGQEVMSNLYLSIISGGKSIDLCYQSTEERNLWYELFHILIKKEQGILPCPDPLFHQINTTTTTNTTNTMESNAAVVVNEDKDDIGKNRSNIHQDDQQNTYHVTADNDTDDMYPTLPTTEQSQAQYVKQQIIERLLWYSSIGEKVLSIESRIVIADHLPMTLI